VTLNPTLIEGGLPNDIASTLGVGVKLARGNDLRKFLPIQGVSGTKSTFCPGFSKLGQQPSQLYVFELHSKCPYHK